MQYSQFLRPFKRVYHIVGTKQDCQLIKTNYESVGEEKLFEFIINQDLNFDKSNSQARQPVPLPQGGILKSDWLNKLLVLDPMLIILAFNCSKPLQPLEKWEDRLVPISNQIAKAKDYIKSKPNQKIALAIIIVTPNGSLVPLDKIKETVKISDRSLQIVELQSLKAEMKRIKNSWLNTWKSQLDERIKQKQQQKAFKDQTKLRGLIKLACLNQIIAPDEPSHYQKAHTFCRQMYRQMSNIKQQDISSFITKQELRFLGDILFLKAFRNWYRTNPLQSLNRFKLHFNEFRYKNLNSLSFYFYYQQLNWRSQFLTEVINYILGLGIFNSTVDNKVSELIKGIISYNIQLSQLESKIKLQKTVLEELPCQFYGRYNYKIVNEMTFGNDFKNTRLSVIISQRDLLLQKGLLLINQIKDIKKNKQNLDDTKRVKHHQQIFYTISQCRIYIYQNNLQKAVKIYNSVVESFLKKNDFLILNCLLKQFQPLLEKNQHHAELVQFYLVAIKILDYFKSLELLPQFVKQLQSTASELKQPMRYFVAKGSCLLDVRIDYHTITSLLSQKIKITIGLTIHPEIAHLFQNIVIKFKKNLADIAKLQIKQQQTIEIQPSDYLTQEDILQIQQIQLKEKNLIWIVKGDNINYLKKNRVHIIMPMNDPTIKITEFYKKCYTNESIPIEIKIINNNPDTKVFAKVLLNEEKTEKTAECFLMHQPSLNLINTQTHIKLSENTPHMFYFKFPTNGERKINIVVKGQMIKTYYNSKGEKKQVKKALKKYQEERKFTLQPMLIVSKRLTIPRNEYLTKKIQLKQDVYRVPINENVMIQYFITAQENLLLTGIKQQQLDENVKFIRRLNIKDIQLQSKVSLKVFSIIRVLNGKELSNLPSLRIDWKRKGQTIQNTFIDTQSKLATKQKILSIEYKEVDVSKKWEIGTIHYRINNHSNRKFKVRVQAMQTDNVLIVGKNKTDVLMSEQSHVVLTFKILPIAVGEILLPQLLLRVDQKLEAKLQKRHIAFVF